MKGFGILCPISCLPSKHGVGDFGEEAYKFVDLLSKNKVDFWQILPLAKTNEYNSPYGCFSTHTIDEMYVNLDDLVVKGLLKKSEIKFLEKYRKSKKVEYKPVKNAKLKLFEKAYKNANKNLINKAISFSKQKSYIESYAYYMSLLEVFNQNDWRNVDKKYWKMNSSASKSFIKKNEKSYNKYIFYQYILFLQWKNLKKYANDKGIKILGDLPIYCEKESVEVFNNPNYFKLDKNLMPISTGGCPPDCFSELGQDWGTCIYNWEKLKKCKFQFLIDRIKNQIDKFDFLRLDHYIGYVEHYENSKQKDIPSFWEKGGGDEFFKQVKTQIGLEKLFIEDLGILSKECIEVREKYNLKGMLILQFAFDTNDENPYLPKNSRKNNIFYLGNHDNNTFMGFLQELSKEKLEEVKKTLNSNANSLKKLHFDAISSILNSGVDVVILQTQDVLLQDASQRMNVPGRTEGCWEYKMPINYSKLFAKNIKKILKLKKCKSIEK